MAIYRSEDKIIEFTITDQETGDPMDLSVAEMKGIVIFIYQFADKIIEKYSLVATAGYQDITITDDVGGKVEINYEGAKSKMAIDKPLYADIKLRYQNAAFTSGYQDLIAAKVEVDLMQDSVLKYEEVPV